MGADVGALVRADSEVVTHHRAADSRRGRYGVWALPLQATRKPRCPQHSLDRVSGSEQTKSGPRLCYSVRGLARVEYNVQVKAESEHKPNRGGRLLLRRLSTRCGVYIGKTLLLNDTYDVAMRRMW